eukprot:SAG31_NODE_561_length_14087_cov_5.151405_6_plen_322_part_00
MTETPSNTLLVARIFGSPLLPVRLVCSYAVSKFSLHAASRYAMGYGECIENGVSGGPCGMFSNNTVGVWKSMDLSHGSWKRASILRMSSDGWPECTYYRSHAAYSRTTKKYVLWLNAEPGRDSECTACADPESGEPSHCYLAGTSDSPIGPFTYHGVVPVRYTYEGGVGDFDLYVDDDQNGTGYALYKRTGRAPGVYGHRMTLQQLRPDLLGVVESGSVGMDTFAAAPFVEAPAMFKRRGIYYAFFGKCVQHSQCDVRSDLNAAIFWPICRCCAFCAHGSGIGVWTSSGTPLGPWKPQGNIGCDSTAIAEQQFCGCVSTAM